MKKRRKLKKKPIIILALILLSLILLIISCSRKKEETKPEREKQISFLTSFVNNTNEFLDEKIKNKIIDFFDIYYLSIKELNEYDMTYLFSNKNESYINQSAMHFLINYRLLQRNDLKLNKCSYSLNINKILINEDEITVYAYEDSIFNFNFMKNIDSYTYNVENIFTFKKNSNDYDLIKYNKNADFYNLIKSNINEKSSKESILNISKEAISLSASMVENEKNYYNNSNNKPSKKCSHNYDRDKAYQYAITWITKRNPDYANFDAYGGNCQNYASQVIRNGGIPNDLSGYYLFKYYSSIPDETTSNIGRTPSWAGVSQFYDYAKYNSGSGLCSLTDINYLYGEKGDLIQFGYKESWAHTSVIIGDVSKDGKLLDLITSSNTTDRLNFPLSAYNYPNKRLIKIYGWND